MAKAVEKVIKDVIFNYVHIKTPALEYKKEADPTADHMNKEYVVDTLMPFATWKKFKKAYKQVGAIEKARSYTAAEYEAAFKVTPPDAEIYGDEDGDFTLIKFRQRAYYKNTGDATKQPRIIGATKIIAADGKTVVGYKDSEGQEVGTDIAVGNGSFGKIQFKERPWNYKGSDGLNLDLLKLQILTLVAYEAQEDNDDDFDMEEEVQEGAGSDSGFDGDGGDSFDDDDEQDSGSSKQEEDNGGDTGW